MDLTSEKMTLTASLKKSLPVSGERDDDEGHLCQLVLHIIMRGFAIDKEAITEKVRGEQTEGMNCILTTAWC